MPSSNFTRPLVRYKKHSMILNLKSALADDQLIHLTQDNMDSLKNEVTSVRGALQAKFPDEEFPHILPYLDPEHIIPDDPLFEIILGPDPESDIYGGYGCAMRVDRIPYTIFLTKWIGIQVEVETPFVEELLLWVQKMNNDEEVPCRNSQWRHRLFQKRRDLLKTKLKSLLQKEIMDLIMITQSFRDGTLIEETGFWNFMGAFIQRKLLNEANYDSTME